MEFLSGENYWTEELSLSRDFHGARYYDSSICAIDREKERERNSNGISIKLGIVFTGEEGRGEGRLRWLKEFS